MQKKLAPAAASVAETVNELAANSASLRKIDNFTQRIRDSYKLENALIAVPNQDGSQYINFANGLPLNILTATPEHLNQTMTTGSQVEEEYFFLDALYRRYYFPLKRGQQTWGILCLETFDPLPAYLRNLRRGYMAGILISIITALTLALFTLWILRIVERSRQNMLRNERLSTAGFLSATIAHELKNPMGIILSTTQVLKKKLENMPESIRYLSSIEEEVKQANMHLDAFLDLSREIPLHMETQDICSVLMSTVELMEAKLRQQEIQIKTCFPDPPVHVRLDKRKFRQAIVNLLLNAADALSDSRRKIITLSLKRRNSDKGPIVRLSIHDTGPGIPPSIREQIIEPFFSTRDTGTGLGLPQACRIIKQHQGEIIIASTDQNSTTIVIQLPVSNNSLTQQETANEHSDC